jgi:hypothetical protein
LGALMIADRELEQTTESVLRRPGIGNHPVQPG